MTGCSFLHARTPRTRPPALPRRPVPRHYRLDDSGAAQECSIASCPCDDMNLQFHIPVVCRQPVLRRHCLPHCARQRPACASRDRSGDFTLDEDSPRSLAFVAVNTGFGPVKSLIEHAMALDIAEQLRLYWITTPGNSHYLGNLCRSWDDALDNFHYRALKAGDNATVESLLATIIGELDDIASLDFYACMPAPLLDILQAKLLAREVLPGQIRLEQLRENLPVD